MEEVFWVSDRHLPRLVNSESIPESGFGVDSGGLESELESESPGSPPTPQPCLSERSHGPQMLPYLNYIFLLKASLFFLT